MQQVDGALVVGQRRVVVCLIGVVSAARTDTFLGERYRRIARRRGKKRAIVAVGRSILVAIWALLSDEQAQFVDLGPHFYAARTNPSRKVRQHVRELQALGYSVTLNPAA